MAWSGAYSRLSPSQRAGIVAAGASVPTSLVPLLKPRSATDQGLITGVSSALDYALTAGMHDAVLSTSRGILRLVGRSTDVRTTARTTLVVDTVALAASLGRACRTAPPTRRARRAGRGPLDGSPGRERPRSSGWWPACSTRSPGTRVRSTR